MNVPNRAVVHDDRDLIQDLIMNSVSSEWELPKMNAPAGVTARWRKAFLCFRFSDLIAQIETGCRMKQLSVEDREWLKGQVDSLLDDAEVYFGKPHDDGSNFNPDHEPDDSFIEVRR